MTNNLVFCKFFDKSLASSLWVSTSNLKSQVSFEWLKIDFTRWCSWVLYALQTATEFLCCIYSPNIVALIRLGFELTLRPTTQSQNWTYILFTSQQLHKVNNFLPNCISSEPTRSRYLHDIPKNSLFGLFEFLCILFGLRNAA